MTRWPCGKNGSALPISGTESSIAIAEPISEITRPTAMPRESDCRPDIT
jgi:hypothetical protein